MKKGPIIAVIGAGLGGSALGLVLQKLGLNFKIFEQTPKFNKAGAGIHLSPNLLYILDALDASEELIKVGWQPEAFVSLDAYSNKILNTLELGETTYLKYNAPYITVRRGDLHSAMLNKLTKNNLSYNKKLISIRENRETVELTFDDKEKFLADIVIGADGISSVVKNNLILTQADTYSGQAAFRGLIPAYKITPPLKNAVQKWFGENKKFMIGYYLDKHKSTYYYVAGFPRSTWPSSTSFLPAQKSEVIEKFADFHYIPKTLLELTEDVTLWPLRERAMTHVWSKNRLVLIGDACHPMRPHMMSGASMAIEDAMILGRCLAKFGILNYSQAFNTYEKLRRERVSKVHKESMENTWLKTTTDPDWLFRYNATQVSLEDIGISTCQLAD